MEEPSFKSICKSIGKYTPMGQVAYSDVQRKIFEFQNYQNFLKGINLHPRQYFQLPREAFWGGGKKNTPEYHLQQQEALTPLLAYPITENTVDTFEKGLKYFIKTHVLGKDRLFRALKEGRSKHGEVLYKDCVIQTENDEMFGTYNTQLVWGGIEQFSPTINMAKIIKEVEEEYAKEVRAKYRGGSRKTRSKKNRKTRRR